MSSPTHESIIKGISELNVEPELPDEIQPENVGDLELYYDLDNVEFCPDVLLFLNTYPNIKDYLEDEMQCQLEIDYFGNENTEAGRAIANDQLNCGIRWLIDFHLHGTDDDGKINVADLLWMYPQEDSAREQLYWSMRSDNKSMRKMMRSKFKQIVKDHYPNAGDLPPQLFEETYKNRFKKQAKEICTMIWSAFWYWCDDEWIEGDEYWPVNVVETPGGLMSESDADYVKHCLPKD